MGAHAVIAEVVGLETPPGVVSVVIASNFLNRLAGPDAVRQAIISALNSARDYVLIRQPFFDANPQLLALGFELQSSKRPGYPNCMNSDHVWRAVQQQVEGGLADLYVLGRKRIVSSDHPSIVPISNTKKHKNQGDLNSISIQSIKFEFPVFSEMVAIIVKRSHFGA